MLTGGLGDWTRLAVCCGCVVFAVGSWNGLAVANEFTYSVRGSGTGQVSILINQKGDEDISLQCFAEDEHDLYPSKKKRLAPGGATFVFPQDFFGADEAKRGTYAVWCKIPGEGDSRFGTFGYLEEPTGPADSSRDSRAPTGAAAKVGPERAMADPDRFERSYLDFGKLWGGAPDEDGLVQFLLEVGDLPMYSLYAVRGDRLRYSSSKVAPAGSYARGGRVYLYEVRGIFQGCVGAGQGYTECRVEIPPSSSSNPVWMSECRASKTVDGDRRRFGVSKTVLERALRSHGIKYCPRDSDEIRRLLLECWDGSPSVEVYASFKSDLVDEDNASCSVQVHGMTWNRRTWIRVVSGPADTHDVVFELEGSTLSRYWDEPPYLTAPCNEYGSRSDGRSAVVGEWSSFPKYVQDFMCGVGYFPNAE